MAVPKLKRDLIVAQETLSKIGSVCKVRTQDPENFGNYFVPGFVYQLLEALSIFWFLTASPSISIIIS